MVSARPSPSDPHLPEGSRAPASGHGGPGRLNLLLSAGGCIEWRDQSWADALPRLLEPMGVQVWRVRSGREAADVIKRTPVHIALVDLSLPLDTCAPPPGAAAAEEGGPRLLEILSRLASPPPTVVVKGGRSKREDARTLASALTAGAFAVLERPVHIETALEVMRRILHRHYANRWPSCSG